MLKSLSTTLFLMDYLAAVLGGGIVLAMITRSGPPCFLFVGALLFALAINRNDERWGNLATGTITILSLVAAVPIGIVVAQIIHWVDSGFEGMTAPPTPTGLFAYCITFFVLAWSALHWRIMMGIWDRIYRKRKES